MKRFRYLISGRVQGVCFRFFTQEEARRLGLRGWVRNLKTGQVEAEIQGDDEKFIEMNRLLQRGPAMSEVSELIYDEIPLEEGEAGFHIRY